MVYLLNVPIKLAKTTKIILSYWGEFGKMVTQIPLGSK